MKKILLIVLFCLPLLLGQTVVTQFPATITWDAVPFATSYEICLAPMSNRGGAFVIGTTTTLEFTIPSVQYGDWVVGVRSVNNVGMSNISWSDDPAKAPSPFVFRSDIPPVPAAPTNIRLK